MNIVAQSCGLFLMLFIGIFYRRQKKLRIETGRAFVYMQTSTVVCLILDIIAILIMRENKDFPKAAAEFLDKTFLSSLIAVGYFAVMYVYADIYEGRKKEYKKAVAIPKIIGFIGIILVYFLPIENITESENYYSVGGVAARIAYAVFIVFIVFMAYMLVKNKDKMNPRRREAMLIWVAMWTVSSVLHMFFVDRIILSFVAAVGIVVLYVRLENPEMNLDRGTGVYNQNTMVKYMTHLYDDGTEFQAIVLVWNYNINQHLSVDDEKHANKNIIEYLSKLEGAILFKNAEDEIVLLFENEKDISAKITEIKDRFSKGWSVDGWLYATLNYIYFPRCMVARDAKYMLYLIRYARQITNDFAEADHICIDEKLVGEMQQMQQIEEFVKYAMDNDCVEVYYQPIFSTKENRFTSAEALVRLKDGDGNIIAPAVFIDIAEKNGMILQLGEIVFEKVCKFIHENDIESYGLSYIEINLSVVQCADERLADDYIAIMDKYNIDPKKINLEITESASIQAKKILLDNMRKLIDYGIRFSLDDFGTGQSNLNYIIDMPVDIVKFDKVMSNAYFENQKAKHVMNAAMSMIHGLKLEIVSEGIETEEQYKVMSDLGISYIQGYYFSKPLAEAEFLMFLMVNKNANENHQT